MSAVDRDPFAYARAGDDPELVALFHQWCETTAASQKEKRDPEWEELHRRGNQIAEQIFEAPAHGAVGLAIKAFMVGYYEGDSLCKREDWRAISEFSDCSYSRRCIDTEADIWTADAHLFMGPHALRGLLASAAAIFPDLNPFVADIVNSPLTLPVEEEEEGEAQP